MNKSKQLFVRHFRVYFRNGHPAYIIDEEGNKYVFHRVTHSATSSGKKNWKKENPLKSGGNRPMYIVKKEERDKKIKIQPFQIRREGRSRYLVSRNKKSRSITDRFGRE